jgi:hypothetical protein
MCNSLHFELNGRNHEFKLCRRDETPTICICQAQVDSAIVFFREKVVKAHLGSPLGILSFLPRRCCWRLALGVGAIVYIQSLNVKCPHYLVLLLSRRCCCRSSCLPASFDP